VARALLLLALLVAPLSAAEPIQRSVGVRGVLEGVVAPADLRPRRTPAGRPPLVVRVVTAAPHGDACRYTLEFYGLEAGRYDVGDYLELADGTRPADLPALPVEITSPLPPFSAPAPEGLATGQLPRRGGYANALIVGGVLWGLGLLVLAWRAFGRSRAEAAAEAAADVRDPLAELVAHANERSLNTTEQGQLERLLLTRWFLAAGLSEQPPEHALVALREHPVYGPRLATLEAWLHHPQPEPADLAQLVAEEPA